MHQHGIGAWVARRRLRSPDKIALIHGAGATVTYAQFADAVDRVSAVLREHGVGPGDTVAYLGENSPEFLQVMFGAAQVGAVFVPVNTRLAPPEVGYVLADCAARVLIHDPDFAAPVAAALPATRPPHVVVTGEGTPDRPGLAHLTRTVEPGCTGQVDIGPQDPAAIVYTSGTTGRAKGAVLTHGNLTWVALNVWSTTTSSSTDVALMISPMFHVASLGMGALPVLLKGATMVVEQGFEPGRALARSTGTGHQSQRRADHVPVDRRPSGLAHDRHLLPGEAHLRRLRRPARVLHAYEDRGLRFSRGTA